MTNWTVIDTETTGFEDEDTLVEIGMVHSNGTHGHSLVNPGDRRISFGAMATHHITYEDLQDAPGVMEAIGRCGVDEEFLENRVLVFHNAAYDRKYLPPLLTDLPYICTYRCALHLYPTAESHSNGALWYELGLARPLPEEAGRMPHRALFDAFMTSDILVKMSNDLLLITDMEENRLHPDPLAELISMTQRPVLLTKCRFGKYRDTRWEDIDSGYMEWCLRQDFDSDVKYTCEHWLRQRGRL